MRFAAVAVLAAGGLAAAQTTSAPAAQQSSSSSCQAENIVQACLASIQPQVKSCGSNDWVCLCTQYQNLLTCYNNCPNDAERTTVQNQVTAYCNAAAPLMSASSASAAAAGHTAMSSGTAQAQATTMATATTAGSMSMSSGTASAASASSTGAAGSVAVPLTGALAVYGLIGLL